VHSLARLLSCFDVKMNFVSPDILRLPQAVLDDLDAREVAYEQMQSLDEVIGHSDVLYVTRVQKERFEDVSVYEKLKHAYVITPEVLLPARDSMVLMHPFPRVGEIDMEVDRDPRAAYFRQMEYGLYVRMALLAMVLGKA